MYKFVFFITAKIWAACIMMSPETHWNADTLNTERPSNNLVLNVIQTLVMILVDSYNLLMKMMMHVK